MDEKNKNIGIQFEIFNNKTHKISLQIIYASSTQHIIFISISDK